MRIVYFGTVSEFSRAALSVLLDHGLDVCGVIVPAARSDDRPSIAPLVPLNHSPLPILNPFADDTIIQLAWARHIPVYEVSRLAAPKTLSALSFLQPDIACVACFPKRIPASVLRLPRFGFLNLHPSLLPHYRGPYPLFWMFRNGETNTGVTIHFMDECFDSGDIVAQAPIDLPDGVSGEEADRLCATLGGQLLVEVIESLGRGTLMRRKQPDGGSYYPAPTNDDFEIDRSWPARRAFNFMRGTSEWGRAYPIEIDAERWALRRAVAYTVDERLNRAYVLSGDEIAIQFNPGVLRAKV